MNRKFKALGVALFAVLAFGAISAGAAQGAFNAHAEDIVLTDVEGGTFETHKFWADTEAPPVECEALDVQGRNTGAGSGTTWSTATVTVGIDYTECKFEGNPATVDDDGCHYELDSATSGEHAKVKLAGCTANGGITITITEFLTIHVPHQTIENAVHYDNTGSTGNGMTVDVKATANERIAYTCTLEFLCEVGGIAPEGNGSYKGAIEVAGFIYEKGATGSYEHGAQTDVWKE